MVQLSVGSRLRVSPYYPATLAAGLSHVTIYNHMLMPTSYGDPQAEYRRLVEGCALWDVAVERQVELRGPDAWALAQFLVARDLSSAVPGKGRYVPVCNHRGVLINDPVLLPLAEDRYWLSIADSDILLWAQAVAGERGYDVEVLEPDVAPLAVQGPKAEAVVANLFGDWVRDLKLFWFREAELDGIPVILARSGWSKQGGFEIYLQDGSRGVDLWNRVWEAGQPHGIGPGGPNAVERVESGLLSFGSDTDAETDPFEVGMGRYVNLDTPAVFVGKAALQRIAETGPRRRMIGIFVDGDAVVPSDRKWPILKDGETVGFAGSVVHSPRLERNIGVALVRADCAAPGTSLVVHAPDAAREAEATSLPFI